MDKFNLFTLVMITGIHISQQIIAIDRLTALKPSFKNDHNDVLGFLGRYGGQT